MVISNEYDKPVAEGRIAWYSIDENDNPTDLLYKQNTVLNGARTIMRDLLYGGNKTITKLVLGDMNLRFSDNLDLINTTVTPNETVLTHKMAELAITAIEKVNVGARPAVKYSFKIAKNNNLNSETDSAIIAECGLVNDDNIMFSKVVHKPIIKRPFAGLLLEWTIIF